MTKIYACLIGNWVCLNDDPKCKMGTDYRISPYHIQIVSSQVRGNHN